MGKSKRPPGLTSITTNELLPGDILLYNGKALTSKLIRCFDRSYVNHAAVFIGKEIIEVKDIKDEEVKKVEKPVVIESIKQGVKMRTLTESFKHNEYIIVKRYEKVSRETGPVLDVAKIHLMGHRRYEFEAIVFLAIISLVERFHFNRLVAWTVSRTLKQHFSHYLKNNKDQPVTCSELVYRCYNEAVGAGGLDYSFLVDPMPMIRSVLAVGSESSITDQRNLVSKALKAAGKEGLKSAGEISSEESALVMENMYRFACDNIIKHSQAPTAADKKNLLFEIFKIIPHFVTPGDIFKSKSLTDIGIIELDVKK